MLGAGDYKADVEIGTASKTLSVFDVAAAVVILVNYHMTVLEEGRKYNRSLC